jgi:phage antirepressor YoqD-like protein
MKEMMTVKEISDLLNVTPEAIRKHVRELYPDISENGKTLFLTEEQVTRIKQKMLPSTQVVGAVTDLEMQEKAISVMQWMQAKIQEQKLALEQAQPKIEFHDSVTSGDDCFGWKETVKILKLTLGRNKFLILLRAEKILMADNTPYQQYIDDGYFRVTIKHVGHGGVEMVTLVTGKGLAWLQKRYDHIRLKEVV